MYICRRLYYMTNLFILKIIAKKFFLLNNSFYICSIIINLKINKMKNLAVNFSKLDGLYKGGVIFIASVIVPCLVVVMNDVLTNGSNLL